MSCRRGAALLGAVFLLLSFCVVVASPADAALLSPTLDSVTPSQIVPGINNQTVTLHGDFTSGNSTVSFSPDTGIQQVGSPTTVDQNTITVKVNVAADAPNTARDVTVTGGVLGASDTCTKCITVGPDITSVSGPIANTNEAAPFSITGHALKAPVTVTLSRSGYGYNAAETDSIGATNVNVTSTTTITATVNPFGRAPGRWKVSIAQDNGGKASFGDGVTTGLQVAGGKPTLSAIAPTTRINSGETDKQFSLTGSGFARGMTATVSGDGVTQSGPITPAFVSGKIDMTHATLKLTAAQSAPTGPRTLVLRNADGQASTNTDALCVNCDPPTLGAPTIGTVTPTIVGQGASQLPMTITGTNFGVPVPTITIKQNGTTSTAVTATVTRDSATQLTLSLTTAGDAPAGDHDITVANPNGGGSVTKTGAFAVHTDFQVVNVAPAGRPKGFGGANLVNGSGFAGSPTVVVSGSGVTVGTITVESPARIKFGVSVDPNAATGPRDVTVTQGGVSKVCSGCFTVSNVPDVVSISPTAGNGGTPVSIDAINGTNFTNGATATLEQTGQPPINLTETVFSAGPPTKLSGTFDLTNAAPGKWSVRVTNPDGGTDVLADAFTVTQAAPAIAHITPDTLQQKTQTTLAFTGTAFAPGMTVTFPDDSGITVDEVTRKSNTAADVKVTATDIAKLGSRDVKVTNTDGQTSTCDACLTVVQGPQARYFGTGVTAYENFNGGAFVAAGNLDGVPSNGVEFVTAPNAGGGPHIRPYRVNPANGVVQELGGGFMAYGPEFTGGVHVAIGNIDGQPGDEIITGAGPGGGPHVRIFHLNNDLSVSEPFGTGYFAYGPEFHGGVFVGTADVNGDGKDEIITGAGPGGGPHVRVWKLAADGKTFTEVAGWMAYSSAFGGGVAVAGGNFVADEGDKVFEEVATVPSQGGGPHTRVFNGLGQVKREFMAFDASSTDPLGYRVTGGDFDFDTIDDLAVSQVSTTYVVIAQLVDGPDQFSVMAMPQPLGAALAIGTNMAGADVDGDGDDDLIVSPDHNSAVTVRLTRPLS